MSDHGFGVRFPVIAIGASSGGLEACRALLKGLPNNTEGYLAGGPGAAFVLVLHLEPSHDSMMVDLLQDHTELEVVEAADGMALRPGVLHVIPPGVFLTVSHRRLHLSDPKEGKPVRLPFDVLLRSLARDAGALAGCVVLSGNGTDGSMGLADISAAGGLILVQDPAEAGYPGMPDSAIATGLVAQTLTTAQMPAALRAFLANVSDRTDPPGPKVAPVANPTPAAVTAAPAASPPDDSDVDDFDAVLAFVAGFATQDLSLYKRGTLERRVARRMALLGLGAGDMARYLEVLRADAAERTQLSNDLLIHVTSFFRDPAVFDHLGAKAIPELVAALPGDRPLRVWVAGCSTGEEVYSLAMLCLEALEMAGSAKRLQILASDIDPEAVAVARAGFYARDNAEVVSPARLARFFIAEDGGYRVTSALRDVVVFTVADLLSDPPFSKIDLVSCRNVLIYLGPEAQKRVIARCCFALRPGGLLLLGAAEMPGQADTCFAIDTKEAKLWRRVGQTQAGDLHFSIGKREEAALVPIETPARRTALAELCRRIVLETYAPAAVLLNSRLDCLYLLGPTEDYLKVTQGHPDPGIVGMLPKFLRVRFRAAAAACGPGNPRVSFSGGRIDESLPEGTASFDIELHSVTSGNEQLMLACFVKVRRGGGAASRGAAQDADVAWDGLPGAVVAGQTQPGMPPGPPSTRDLEADLEAARSDLSDALRDLEHEVEAHGADAAEALSVNEEFQSANEELLASKEELQSLNEELTALNGQLQETLERQRTTANDLQNVLYSTDVATLFLDLDLNIRFFTPMARAIFRVIPSDIGRPLSDLATVARDDTLAEDARAVLAQSAPSERETAGADGQWFLRRIQPYRAEGGRIEGVVITYFDITERKRNSEALFTAMGEAERATRAKSRFLASASHDLRQPMQSMALLHKLLAGQKRSTEGIRLATLLDQTLLSMTAMLDSMLDVNRIESGVVRPEMRPVAVDPILQRLVGEFAPQCELKGLRLRSVGCSAWVRTDPQLLEQMLRNLLSNALKYTPKGGILIGCRRHGATLTLSVCDTGIGVAQSESRAIFEAYHQVDKTASLSGKGLGLGLSIVQRLAKLMDHPVSLRSTPGKGSNFMIALPVVDGLAADASLHLSTALVPVATRRTGVILLVEDEEPLRTLLADVLTREGHTVISKPTAQEARDWASTDAPPPDLLLTDFELHGGSDGLQLAQDLPDILGVAVPTIILTGDITTSTLQSIGASPYHQVVKPVMPEVLLAQISELMHKARAAQANAQPAATSVGTTTIHIIDDDPLVREITRRLVEAEGWAAITYASAEEFLAKPRPGGVACLLVDVVLPGMDGVALITRLRSEGSTVPAIVLTAHGDAGMAVAALKAGASDLIEKPASAADLLASIRLALPSGTTGQPLASQRSMAQEPFASLTPRERDVLARVLAGQPNKIISADLGINQRTVENHRASVMRKTGAKSLPALVRLAIAADVVGK